MASKDARNLLAATGGAVKYAPLGTPLPTGLDHPFDPTKWSNLGAIKTQPSLSSSMTNQTVSLWNMDDITLGGTESYTIDFGAGQFDYESLVLFFNAVMNEDGKGFKPGKTAWSGMLAILIQKADEEILLVAPNATITSKGTIDFVKNDLAEMPMTLALNPDASIDAPFIWFSSKAYTREVVVTVP